MSARFFAFAAALLLALMAILAGGAARRESVTFDEVTHVAAGVSYLQKLDMRLNEEHPPLAKLIAALPLALRGAHADYSHISWPFSEHIFYQFLGQWVFGHWFLMTWNDPHTTLLWARAPMLLLTLLVGFLLYRYASRLGGPWGGLLSLSAFVTMPVMIAFGPLAITDIAITFFWLLTIWYLPSMWSNPSRATILRFSLAFAGALLSKFSSGLLFFVFIAFALSLRWKPLPGQPAEQPDLKRWRRQAWRNILKGTLWAAFFVYAAYFVLSWNQPTDSFTLIHFPSSPILRRLMMPPWLYLRGLALFVLTAGSRPTYILGQAYSHGVWFYFPVLFFLKSQLSFLALLLIAAATAFFKKGSSVIADPMRPQWRSISVSLGIFTAACMLNRLDISIRHFSVALALITLLLAPLPRLLEQLQPRTARIGKWAAIALASISIVTAIAIYPNYLPYFNPLGMGRPGYLLANDSNLDWNQALPEVEHFVLQKNLKTVLLDEYGFVEPTIYVPQAVEWNCQQPAPDSGARWAVVSANYLNDARNCIWLMKYPHETIAAGSMYAFELPPVIPAAGQPGGPPLPADFRYLGAGVGFDPLEIFAKCVRDPQQLQPTADHFQELMQTQMQKK